MRPILEMFALEGNPDYSSFKNSTPIIEFAYKLMVKSLNRGYKFDVKDEYKTQGLIEGAFEHSRP